ncbi:MAG: potassium channel protein [Cyanobacteria bacterium P01_C01_bin.89]
MQDSQHRILTGFAFFMGTIAIAILGYIGFGWTPLEAAYMVVITIFGVGYGEVKPLEGAAQKVFTMLVIIAGTTSAVYIVGGFLQMVTEGEIHRALNLQQRQRAMANLQDHAIICGFGRMGQVIAQQLDAAKYPFAIIDNDPERIALAEKCGYLIHDGDATHEDSLHAVSILSARTLATALPDDATNVFITLTARELNNDLMILARGEVPETERKLRLAGADRVILPITVGGVQMASLMAEGDRRDFLNQPEERSFLNDLLANIEVQMDELTVRRGSLALGRTVMEMEVRAKGAFIAIAIRRADGSTIFRPHPSQILHLGDSLIVIGHRNEIPQFAERYDFRRKQLKVRRSSLPS